MNHHALKSTRSLASAWDKQTGHHTMILHLVGENVWHETPCCNAFCQRQASWAWQTPSKRILRGSNVFSFFSTGTLDIPWFYLARQFWKTVNRFDPSADHLILEVDVMSGAVDAAMRRWGGQRLQHLPVVDGEVSMILPCKLIEDLRPNWSQRMHLWVNSGPKWPQCSTPLVGLGRLEENPWKPFSLPGTNKRNKPCRCLPHPNRKANPKMPRASMKNVNLTPPEAWPNDVLQWSLGNGIVCNLQALFPRFHLIQVGIQPMLHPSGWLSTKMFSY